MSNFIIVRGGEMAIKYGKKKHKRHYVLYTVITAFLLSAVFLTMVASLYVNAEEEAYENLHSQTKQIHCLIFQILHQYVILIHHILFHSD